MKPGVVSVKVKLDDTAEADDDGPGQGRGLQNVPPQLREFFKRFGQGGPNGAVPGTPQRQGQRGAVGSGFIISADGYVVTNNHVVDHAKTVQVTLDDSRTLDAKVIGKDFKTDSLSSRSRTAAPSRTSSSGRPPRASATGWWRSATRSASAAP